MSEETQEKLFVVCNILVGDDSIDPIWGGSRADYFEVRYDGNPIRIPAGETMVLAEHLANHFAKHLIDHILVSEGKMMHDEAHRQPLKDRIILREAHEVDRSFHSDSSGD